MRVLTTLFWKELKEIAPYGLLLIATSVIGTLLGCWLLPKSMFLNLFANSKTLSAEIAFANLAYTTPTLVVLVCVSLSFSIEHENRSYFFYRTLPVSPADLLFAKTGVCLLLVILSILICWPLSVWLVNPIADVFTPGHGNPFQHVGLTLIGIFEAALWSLYFSLRERKVLAAIVKATVAYLLLPNGLLVFLSYLAGDQPKHDAFFYWAAFAMRSVVAVVVSQRISVHIHRWLGDPVDKQSSLRQSTRIIEKSSVGSLGRWLRLIWLFDREQRTTICCFAIVSTVLFLGEPVFSEHWTGGSFVVFLWVILVSWVGVMAEKGSRSVRPVMLGFKPRQVWTTFTVLSFLVVLASSLLFHLVSLGFSPLSMGGPISSRHLTYYPWIGLTAFATGQFASMWCRSKISAMILSAAACVLSLSLFHFSLQSFNSQLPMIVLLIALPLALVGWWRNQLVTKGSLGMNDWVMAPALYLILVLPLPLLRIYDVESPEIKPIILQAETLGSADKERLIQIRNIVDAFRLVKPIYSPVKGIESNSSDYDRNEYIETVCQLFALDSNQSILLANPGSFKLDLSRWLEIQRELSVLANEFKLQLYQGTASYEQINLYVTNVLDWSPSFEQGNAPILTWWALHPRTTNEAVRSVIRRLSDESEIYNLFRVLAYADFRYSMAGAESRPDQFPRILGTFPGLINYYLPWETSRFMRNAKQLLAGTWRQIDEIEQQHGINQYGRIEYTNEYHRAKGGDTWIGAHMEYFRVFYPPVIPKALTLRRANRIHLAVLLWQKDHDGNPPDKLPDLVLNYLKFLPVSAYDGGPFLYAPKGLPRTAFKSNHHSNAVQNSWNSWSPESQYSETLRPFKVADQIPFFWINVPTASEETLQIKTVDEFETKNDTKSNLEIWMVPKPDQTRFKK